MSMPMISLLAAVMTSSGIVAAPGIPRSASGALLDEYRCTGRLYPARLECRAGQAASGSGPAILGASGVWLNTADVAYDSASRIFSFDASLRNLRSEPIGTPDGATVAGLKAFYEADPAPAAQAAENARIIAVANADGVQSFTRADQPYHHYSEIVQPQATTFTKRWRIRVPPTAEVFTFTVRVFTRVPSEAEIPLPIPSDWRMPRRYHLEESYAYCGFSGVGRCVADGIDLRFEPEATQEERLSAVNMVGGVVEGGVAEISLYYIRIPADTTMATMRDAVTRLRALPQVQSVSPHAYPTLAPDQGRP